jgi:hypothetical protein
MRWRARNRTALLERTSLLARKRGIHRRMLSFTTAEESTAAPLRSDRRALATTATILAQSDHERRGQEWAASTNASTKLPTLTVDSLFEQAFYSK